MSVLIKGMEMPTSCHECQLVDILPTCPCNQMADEDFWNNVSLAVEGHKDCPLVPVPPHGDLIDYDFCMANYELLHDDDGNHAYAVRMRDINNAPTIIPAEEGET